MKHELISKKTRNAFRDCLSNWTIRAIERVFDEADITCNTFPAPDSFDERDNLVNKLYNTLDLYNPVDVEKLMKVYESILEQSYQEEDRLNEYLKKDGFTYRDNKIVPITPETKKLFEAISERQISEITRRKIFDIYFIDGISWAGRFEEPDFLSRLYDHENMDDIWRHRVHFPDDWSDDWILTDSRFNLSKSPDNEFLIFLCETIHPAVRPDEEEVTKLLETYNVHLRKDGYELISRTQISGKPVFTAHRLLSIGNPALNAAKYLTKKLSAEYISQQITRMEVSIESDPELAIGTAKELVETICKTILEEYGETPKSSKVQQLVKQVFKILDILPEKVPDKVKGAESIRLVLQNLGTVAQHLAELRNIWGTGHGKSAKTRNIPPRVAKLAVGSACTLCEYILEVYQMRKEKKEEV